LEDIAVIVDESIPASRVEALIRQTGGKSVTNVRLFDLYRGDQIGAGKSRWLIISPTKPPIKR